MDRKMEKSMVALGDEELGAVSGAGDIVSLFSPVTVTQLNVNAPSATALSLLGPATISQDATQVNQSSVSYSHS